MSSAHEGGGGRVGGPGGDPLLGPPGSAANVGGNGGAASAGTKPLKLPDLSGEKGSDA